MAEQQLIDYIKKSQSQGQADAKTRELLAKNGWSEAEIGEAFLAAGPAQPNTQQQMPKIKRGSNFSILRISVILLVLIGLGVGGYFSIEPIKNLLNSGSNVVPTQTKGEDVVTEQTPVSPTSYPTFSTYKLESSKYTPALPEYQISLGEISNLNNFQKARGNFTKIQSDYLVKNNFLITKNNDAFYNTSNATDAVSGRNDDWTYLYGKIGGPGDPALRQPENSVFISTDFVAHTYHKLIDEEFSYIEESKFYPTLNSLTKSLLTAAVASYKSETSPEQKASYERLSAYFLIPLAILDNATADYNQFVTQYFMNDSGADKKAAVLANVDKLATQYSISDNAKNIASQEVNLIFDATATVSSPLMGKYQGPEMKEDYTQFKPRSHYANNVVLRNYFRAMMFYGRMNFLLRSPELTRDAANISLLMTVDQKKQWESIYQPTAFFVGKADDLGVYDYIKAGGKTGFKTSSKETTDVKKLQDELLTYQNPQIMSSLIVGDSVTTSTKEELQNTTKGFRFMGQRFTPDAFIFSTLTQGDEKPDPKTGQSLPSTPTALMVSTLMGSKESATLLDQWIKDSAPNSDKVLADRISSLQSYFAKTTEQQWTQNIYWSWLYTIKSLFTDIADKTGFPMFMKSDDWNKKSLQAFLGSWTELKHDTLLYAKQSYAEMGAGGGEQLPPNPVPKGYVEPNIAFFDRMISLVNLTKDGLKSFDLLPGDFESRNDRLLESLKLYRKIAIAEIQNEKISDEDFDKLRLDAHSLDYILSSPDSQVQLEKNARSALIADVHTDGKMQQILYEADGIPNYIYVAVKDANGTRLTKGLVYSYYEFTGPLGKRYTDQDWQGWSYSNKTKIPSLPWWNKELVK